MPIEQIITQSPKAFSGSSTCSRASQGQVLGLVYSESPASTSLGMWRVLVVSCINDPNSPPLLVPTPFIL